MSSVPVIPRSPAVAALRSPGVARLLVLSLVARAPEAVLALLFLLRARDLGGSYALAGAVSGIAGVGMAVGAPLLGRAIDRIGQPVVLAASVLAASVAMLAAALLPDTTAAWVLLPFALVAGATQPPVAACLRALFGRIVPDPAVRHAALAVEASVQEITFMVGPLVFISLIAAHDPALGLGVAAVVLFAATMAFAAAREPREMPASGVRRTAGDGPLRRASIRALLAITVGLGVMFGAAELAITAAAEDAGNAGAVGLLLAAYCLGSLVAGLTVAHRGPGGGSPERALLRLVLLCTLGHGLLAVAPSLVLLAVGLVLAGAAIAPLFTVVYSLCGQLAEEGTATEAFTWLGSGLYAGAAVGAGLAGLLVNASGPAAAFAAGAVAIGIAGVAVTPFRRVLRPAAAPD
ncbi:MFS transporter [Patulibacter sp. NPDC049589]|uniref:MFS transporter n=1 Tax=Patulibacter sp. NPDC049589 TaxID=3154731 RepID=UPI003421CC36